MSYHLIPLSVYLMVFTSLLMDIHFYGFKIRKYEEIKPKNVAEFCDITDNTYTQQQVLKMEADLLKTLKFEMGNPTVKTFLG